MGAILDLDQPPLKDRAQQAKLHTHISGCCFILLVIRAHLPHGYHCLLLSWRQSIPERPLLRGGRPLLTGRMTKSVADEWLFQLDLGCPQESLPPSKFTPPLWILWPLSFGSVSGVSIIKSG